MNNQNTKIFSMGAFLIAFLVIVLACSPHIKAQTCQPSEGKTGTEPSEQCNTENSSECCVEGRFYETYECSPPVSSSTDATLTLNSFQEGGDGGGESACDGNFHSDETAVVALSTGWYNKGSRCGNFITINGNGRSVQAKVVDECDSTTGCDEEHAFQPPCRNNIVDASKAVWEALGVSQDDQGELEITWSDA